VTVGFLEQWREHLVESKPEPRSLVPYHHWGLNEDLLRFPAEARLDDALEEISQRCASLSVREEDWLAEVHALATGEVSQIIIVGCMKNGVTPEDLLTWAEQSMLQY
jgi:alkylhydroperoxidase/carboxymuconolactone decarboxylase family protein YurZ